MGTHTACLALESGEVIWGYGLGRAGRAVGELCFHTALSGYQEIMTDPSYAGQIVIFTAPHIGNVGCNAADCEARAPAFRGVVLREAPDTVSNFRAQSDLHSWLQEQGIGGICGVDTRALTRLVRTRGAVKASLCVLADAGGASAESVVDVQQEIARARSWAGIEHADLAAEVSCRDSYTWRGAGNGGGGLWCPHEGYATRDEEGVESATGTFLVVAVDFGIKHNILRHLTACGCRVRVVPARTSAATILAYRPHGVFLSNGPGDPEATGEYAVPMVQELLQAGVPIFGICLGHQILARALGARTEKMHNGHHGANHPVMDVLRDKVEITSQNHGFVVVRAHLPDTVEVTHYSLFDNSLAGLRVRGAPAFSVQYHPEASPGPTDSRYLFTRFTDMMRAHSVSGTGISGASVSGTGVSSAAASQQAPLTGT